MPAFTFHDQLSSMAKERLEPSEIGVMAKLAAENGAVSFTSGEPSDDIYPLEGLKEAFAAVFDDISLLAYYKYDFGFLELREWIAERMKTDSMAPDWTDAKNILLTNGAGDAIELIAEAMIDPGSLVLVETPTFTDAMLIFRKQGAQCLGVPCDDEGIIPAAMEEILKKRRVRFLYTIPNFQNPSGRTASLRRRKAVLEVAEKYGLPILEDDPYHYLSYEGEPPATYLKLAGADKRVIHSNSFSKLVAPGLRCGWAVVPDEVVRQFEALRLCSGLSRPAVIHKGLLNYLRNVDFNQRVAYLRDVFRTRRDGMASAAEKHLKPIGVKVNHPGGGFFMWAEKEGIADMTSFARFAVEKKKIGIIPGSAFYTPDEAWAGRNSFRIAFSKVAPDVADLGAARLAEAFTEYR